MTVKPHRCRFTNRLINKNRFHACGRVEKALEAQGIEYERVLVTTKQKTRPRTFEVSGQYLVPMIEFEDGSGYRVESKNMAAEINAGRLFEHQGTGGGAS